MSKLREQRIEMLKEIAEDRRHDHNIPDRKSRYQSCTDTHLY